MKNFRHPSPHIILHSAFRILHCAICMAFAASAASAMQIAAGGKAQAVIATPPSPAPSVAYAAKELAKYLGKMTGAPFEVVTNVPASAAAIRVGDPYEAKRPEEIRLRAADGKTFLVTGEGPRGPLYAVYRLLEELGCGFWAPGNETVPTVRDLAIPDSLDITDAPFFEVRQPHGESTWSHPDWKPKIGVNGDMYAGTIKPEWGGHRQYDLSQSMAGLGGAKAFAEHPEWFAWRKAEKKRTQQQLCMTDPGCREEVVRRAKAKLRADPSRTQVSVSVNDGFDFCQCAKCEALRAREGGNIGPELDIANYVAREIREEFPYARVLTFAYETTEKPPKTLKPEPNVDICFACIQRNYALPPAGTPRHNPLLAEWSRLTDKHVYIWGYNAQFTDYMIPWPTIGTLGDEMRTYRDFGVKGVYMQLGEGRLSDFIDLRCWLCAKLMWNPAQNEWALIEKWCRGACGDGAPFVLEWLRELDKIRIRAKSLGLYGGDPRGFLTPGDLFKGQALFDKAEAATKDDPRTYTQVRKLSTSIIHTFLIRYNHDIAAAAHSRGADHSRGAGPSQNAEQSRGAEHSRGAGPSRPAFLPSRAELLADLKQRCETYRNYTYREGWAWHGAFLPRIRHGEVLPEKKGDGPKSRGEWTFRNPVASGTEEDPFVTYDPATKFYYRLVTDKDALRIRRAKRAVALFDKECEEMVACRLCGKIPKLIRGPELHKGADGRWRIYACGGEDGLALDGEVADAVIPNRLLVLEGGGNPFGSYTFKARLQPEETAMDPTVFTMDNGKTYLCYAAESPRRGLFVRELASPDKVGTHGGAILGAKNVDAVPLSPALVHMGGQIYLLYGTGGRSSASATVRALRYAGGDPVLAKSWEACKDPVLLPGNAFRNDNAILAGPRALSAFTSADGTETWCLFRGWNKNKPVNFAKDTIVCMQRLDDGLPDGRLLFKTGAELRILLLQPSGDYQIGDRR